MSQPIVKVCGVTTEEEIEHLSRFRVEFFGLVVDVPSPWAVTPKRAKELAARSNQRIRPTLITGPHPPDMLARLIEETGVTAIQLGVLTAPKHIRQLRRTFRTEDLTIVQEISYRRGQFWKEEQVAEYLAAGADFILVDKLKEMDRGDTPSHATIPESELEVFRRRHVGQPILVAGGVSPDNVRALMAASGAVGIDVCSSVRRDGLIRPELVAKLMEQLGESPPMPGSSRPSLCGFLKAVVPGNHLIAYLTIGDPPGRFLAVANEVLEAGALTLELGFPYSEPTEGAALLASHQRALNAGVNTQKAMGMFKAIAQQHPQTPLVAVVQWPAIKSEDELGRFLDGLVDAGAAAVLPVGLPFWQLPAFAAHVHQRGLQTVVACPPSSSRKLRQIALRYCSGCLYVPQGRVTGGSKEFANVADFCHLVSTETGTPTIVGVGVRDPQDVAEICSTPAKAAAVGTALIDHVTKGGSAGEFVRRLISG